MVVVSYTYYTYVELEAMQKIDKILDAAVKEESILIEQQPPHVDYDEAKIKCFWCKEIFSGSDQLKYINQHVRKSRTHQKKKRIS